jgi:FtsZ-binding cell division protein ZapB
MGFAKLHQHLDQITTVQNTIKALNEPKNQSSCQTSSQAQKNHHVTNKWPQQQQFQSKIKSFKESFQRFEENFKTHHVKAP